MLKIYIVRHATAQERSEDLPDFERPLVKKGEKEAAAVAADLAERHAAPDLMISSFANRAIETAHLFAKAFRYPRRKILLLKSFYGGTGIEEIAAEIRKQPDACRSLMLFGHDPAFSQLAAQLIMGFREIIPKAGVVVAELPAEHWRDIESGSGQLLEFTGPAVIKEKKEERKKARIDIEPRPAAGASTPMPLKDCYDRRVRYFDDHFALTSEFPSTAAVHDMRVGLKRLRTFFGLIGSIGTGFGAEEAFASARKLFRAAGKVRNLHVLETRTREASTADSPELSEYYNWLKEDELREVRKFGRACRHFREDFFASAWTSMASVLEGLTDHEVKRGAENRLLALIKEIRTERSMKRDVRRLHFLRTRTKEARYTLEIIQECGLTRDEGAVLNDLLRDVHQSLGCWHDEEIVLESLREFRKRWAPGKLASFKSYLAFSRLTKARKAESLADFESAWAAFLKFLGRGDGRRVIK